MKSRRRILPPKGSGVHRPSLTGCDYSRDLRPAKWGSGPGCTATLLNCSCPLWVKSGHWSTSDQCPLYPQKRTLFGTLLWCANVQLPWWEGDRVPDAQPCKRLTLSAAEIVFQDQLVGLERSRYLKIGLSPPHNFLSSSPKLGTFMLDMTTRVVAESVFDRNKRREAEINEALKQEKARREAAVKNMLRLRALRLARDAKLKNQ
jgi:hypothetical protein